PVDADRGDVTDPHPGDVHVVARVQPGHVGEHRLVADRGGDPAVRDADAQDRGDRGRDHDEDERLDDRAGQALALHAAALRFTVVPRNSGAVSRLAQGGTSATERCRPGWLVPLPSSLSTAGSKLTRSFSTHGNSGEYRARICSEATLSAFSLMMFAELASRNACRSPAAVVTVPYSAERLSRWATIVWLVMVKSVSAWTRSGDAWLR